ncbi:MAG: hypothetical protein PVF43_01240 [Candidatus Eiseniibacteriota bacterium]
MRAQPLARPQAPQVLGLAVAILAASLLAGSGRPAGARHPDDDRAASTAVADSAFAAAPLEARVAMVMDHYQSVEAQWREALPEAAGVEARALADTGEDLLVWGDDALALELLREALALYAAAGLPVDSLLAGLREPVPHESSADVP